MRIVDANEIVKDILWVRDNDLHSGYPHAFELGAIRKALRCVEEAKTIDIESLRPQGEWLDATYVYFGAKRYVCNQCADDEFWQERFVIVKEKFCPNCGAKMI